MPYTLPFLGRTVPEASLALQTADNTYYRRLDGTTGQPRLTHNPSPADATLTGNPTALTAWQQAIDG